MTLRALQAVDAPLVLASGSAARSALLRDCGLLFEVCVPAVDETSIKQRFRQAGRLPSEAALALARAKAGTIAARRPDALVIGADQILSSNGEWFDKPASLDEARQQLGRLTGHAQRLHTAAVLMRGPTLVWSHVAEPEIVLRRASDRILDAYVAEEGEALLRSVGACRVEGAGQMLIERIEGEHAAVLGLPLLALLSALRTEGVLPA